MAKILSSLVWNYPILKGFSKRKFLNYDGVAALYIKSPRNDMSDVRGQNEKVE